MQLDSCLIVCLFYSVGYGQSKFKKSFGKNKSANGSKFKGATPIEIVPIKQDWGKFKKEKKDLKLKRKQGKDLFELTVESKKLYEKLKW